MNHAVAVNVLIVFIIAFTIWVTHNPLALFALMLIKDLPYEVIFNPNLQRDSEEQNEEGNPIGFTN